MSTTTAIPDTPLAGTQTLNLPATTQVWNTAQIVIDRTIASGLNSVALGQTLDIAFDYSLDGGTTWTNVASSTLRCGTLTTAKGTTINQDSLGINKGSPFPVGTLFRVRTVASAPVHIAGSAVYS